ncbi:polyprenyl diphosphate synthase [Ktedonobacter robiniae]|uniref:Isoprenyl transferase n=1 Tax=Ktedonobacter robiniae TaxID=2778365 RepID=A0ABQ3UY65_9CHLR|nr:polyprenyl diphosphate synthase [Ktedonobacter robiniae]GHO57824.1 isoprenyl transferase [Ktedonobacter robiniae]
MQLLSTLDTTFKRSFSSFALKRLEAEKDQWQVPRHLGLIMDGNRRYARKHHIWDTKQKQFGHAQGAEKLEEVLHWCHELGIKIVSAWGLSLDNFRRDRVEVDTILELVKKKSDKFTHHPDAHAKQTRVRFLGELQHLPLDVQDAIHFTEEATKEHDQCLLNICLGYDGREEILTAFRRHLMVQLEQGKNLAQATNALSLEAISSHIYTSGLPDPDLIIRTSGEKRLNGFLLWQSVYTEYAFCPTYWPELSRQDFLQVLKDYNQRERRFGK